MRVMPRFRMVATDTPTGHTSLRQRLLSSKGKLQHFKVPWHSSGRRGEGWPRGGVVNVRRGPERARRTCGNERARGGYTVSRGVLAVRPGLKQSGCSGGAMGRWAKKSGGSAGAAFSGREIGSRFGRVDSVERAIWPWCRRSQG